MSYTPNSLFSSDVLQDYSMPDPLSMDAFDLNWGAPTGMPLGANANNNSFSPLNLAGTGGGIAPSQNAFNMGGPLGGGGGQGPLSWWKNPDMLKGWGSIIGAGANVANYFNGRDMAKTAQQQAAFQEDAFNKQFNLAETAFNERRSRHNKLRAQYS